jgi:hypothetical protein
MELFNFYSQLKAHDWSYQYSDDHGVYRSGSAQQQHLHRLSQQSPKHTELYAAFRAWFSDAERHPQRGYGPMPKLAVCPHCGDDIVLPSDTPQHHDCRPRAA